MDNKQPIVATNHYKKSEKEEKIRTVLKVHPEGIYPKILSLYTKINVNTVKSLLKNMPDINKKEGMRGLYYLVEKDPHSIFDYTFHNAILTIILKEYTGKKINETIEFDFQNFRFGIGKNTKQATLHICSKYPINIASILVCANYFKSLIKQYTELDIETKDIIVRSIEFNKDYLNLKLEGLNCITIDGLLFQYKAYNKSLGVREEFKTKVPIPFEVLAALLKRGANHSELSYRMDILESQNNQIILQNKTMINTVNRLLNHFFKENGNTITNPS